MFGKTPLAWKNLTHDWRRLSVAVGGICFAVVLMFMQRGFQNALFDSQVKLVDELNEDLADIIIVSKARYALPAQKRFPRHRLLGARSLPQVKDVFPLYIETEAALLKAPAHSPHPIRAIGFDPQTQLFKSQSVRRHAGALRRPNTAIIDRLSKADKFPIKFAELSETRTESVELTGRAIELVGDFVMGLDFATEGTLLASEENFATFFPARVPLGDPLSMVDLGIVQLVDGANVDEVVPQLRSVLGDDVRILSRADFRHREIRFWDKNTPIGIIFATGTVMGFVVGIIICYQIIYGDISDHLSEFATLKAMGYKTSYFVRVIIAESIYLSLLGFVPGAILSWIIYGFLAESTGLMLTMMPPSRILFVLLLTVLMCIGSGVLALRKLMAADPADLF